METLGQLCRCTMCLSGVVSCKSGLRYVRCNIWSLWIVWWALFDKDGAVLSEKDDDIISLAKALLDGVLFVCRQCATE